jgi:hypothetical protein
MRRAGLRDERQGFYVGASWLVRTSEREREELLRSNVSVKAKGGAEGDVKER